jgi:hypothetical protein
MARMRREHGRAYDFYAQTFHLPAERDKFRAELDKDPRQAWILKPAASSCGRGIKLCTRAAGVMLPRSKKYIAQKYIDRPLLVDGCAPACSSAVQSPAGACAIRRHYLDGHPTRGCACSLKFDLRIYVLVTSFDPLVRAACGAAAAAGPLPSLLTHVLLRSASTFGTTGASPVVVP